MSEMTQEEHIALGFIALLENTVVLTDEEMAHLIRLMSSGSLWNAETFEGVPTKNIPYEGNPRWNAIHDRMVALMRPAWMWMHNSKFYQDNEWPIAHPRVPQYSPPDSVSFRDWMDQNLYIRDIA